MRWLFVALAACAGHAATPAQTPARDPQIEASVARLDRDPDILHVDMTPAVEELGMRGPEMVPYLVEALRATQQMTRLHAQRAVERMLERRLGFVPGQGWTKPGGEDRFRALWAENGSYDADAPAAARERSIRAWLTWSANPR